MHNLKVSREIKALRNLARRLRCLTRNQIFSLEKMQTHNAKAMTDASQEKQARILGILTKQVEFLIALDVRLEGLEREDEASAHQSESNLQANAQRNREALAQRLEQFVRPKAESLPHESE